MTDIDALVARANGGDSAALEELVGRVQDRVYRLALRMVTRPVEAEDATQEILIRVMTRLSTYRGEAAFTTWVHRVAVNHLLDRKKTVVEAMELSFDAYAEDLRSGLSKEVSPDAALLAEEIRLSCTQAMLTCLDRDHRIAYVLGEVFDVSSSDGAYICDTTPAAYRKRLSRARSRVRSFVGQNCGLVNPQGAPCRCERRVETAVALGRIDPARLEFSDHRVTHGVMEMEKLHDAAGLMRSHPDYAVPEALADRIALLIRSGRYRLFAR
jgi:RNA polymerase sigma factor (sigma-70 family)